MGTCSAKLATEQNGATSGESYEAGVSSKLPTKYLKPQLHLAI